MAVQLKDVSEVIDFTHDWSSWLSGSEVIATSAWAVSPIGTLTIDSESETATAATVWLSAGTRGEVYEVTNTITTDSSPVRTGERKLVVRVENR